MAVRNPYTDSDDENLISYIATYNAAAEGRQGNKLYQVLEENASGKWPWSKNHPWSSWRERYKKNQAYFDRKIRQELRTRARCSAHAEGAVAGSSKEVAKTLAKQPETTKDKHTVPATRGTVRALANREKRAVTKNGTSGERYREEPPTGTHQTKHVETSAKTVLPKKRVVEVVSDSQREDEEEAHAGPVGSNDYTNEVFASYVEKDNDEPKVSPSSSSSSSVPSEHPRLKKEPQLPPPKLSQGPTPPKSDVTPIRVLPQPKRVKRKIPQDDDPFATPPASSPSASPPAPTTRGPPPIYVEGPFRTTIKRPRVVSSDVTAHAWPPKRRKKDIPAELAQDVEMGDVEPRKAQQLPSRKPGHIRLPPPIYSVASSSKVKLPEAKQIVPARPVGPTTPEPPLDAFTFKGKGRAVEEDQSKVPRRIDLQRESMHMHRNSRGGSRSSTVTAESSRIRRSKGHDRPSVLSPTQEDLFAMFKRDLHHLGDEYGFSANVVEKTYQQTGSMEKTRIVLESLNASMKAAEQALHVGMPHLFLHMQDVEMGAGTDEEGEVPDGVVPTTNGLLHSAENYPRDSSLRKGVPRRSLTIKRTPHGEEDRVSDYSPPNASRAGQYARLVRQGRKEEALARERRRASGVFVPHTQEKARVQHGSPMTNPSPTPAARGPTSEIIEVLAAAPAPSVSVAADDDCDDFYTTEEQEQADDEYEPEASSQPTLETLPRGQQNPRVPREAIVEEAIDAKVETPERPHSQRSKDADVQTTFEDDLKELQQDYRRLALSVNAENADAMRALERKVGRSTAKSWSFALLKERVERIAMAAELEMDEEAGVAREEGYDRM